MSVVVKCALQAAKHHLLTPLSGRQNQKKGRMPGLGEGQLDRKEKGEGWKGRRRKTNEYTKQTIYNWHGFHDKGAKGPTDSCLKEGGGKGKGKETGLDKENSGNEPKEKKINLQNIVVECEIIQYNTIRLKLMLINQIKCETDF